MKKLSSLLRKSEMWWFVRILPALGLLVVGLSLLDGCTNVGEAQTTLEANLFGGDNDHFNKVMANTGVVYQIVRIGGNGPVAHHEVRQLGVRFARRNHSVTTGTAWDLKIHNVNLVEGGLYPNLTSIVCQQQYSSLTFPNQAAVDTNLPIVETVIDLPSSCGTLEYNKFYSLSLTCAGGNCGSFGYWHTVTDNDSGDYVHNLMTCASICTLLENWVVSDEQVLFRFFGETHALEFVDESEHWLIRFLRYLGAETTFGHILVSLVLGGVVFALGLMARLSGLILALVLVAFLVGLVDIGVFPATWFISGMMAAGLVILVKTTMGGGNRG